MRMSLSKAASIRDRPVLKVRKPRVRCPVCGRYVNDVQSHAVKEADPIHDVLLVLES
jgi:hypothetical protein